MFDEKSTDRVVEMFVFDVFIAILKIKDTVKDFKSVQDLLYSYRDWDSVIREFEIIGEASNYLIKSNLLDKEYRVVVDLRNYIIHKYFGISPERIWDIVYGGDLDELQNIILGIIDEMDRDLKIELIDSFIEDNRYLDFVVKELQALT